MTRPRKPRRLFGIPVRRGGGVAVMAATLVSLVPVAESAARTAESGTVCLVATDHFSFSGSKKVANLVFIAVPMLVMAAARGRISLWAASWLIDAAFAGLLLALPGVGEVCTWPPRSGRVDWPCWWQCGIEWGIMAALSLAASSLWIRDRSGGPRSARETAMRDDDGPETTAPRPLRWLDPAVLVATCGGLGRIGVAPGTFGAAAGLVAAVGLARAGLPPLFETGLLVAVNLVGVPCCTRAARLLGLGKDPGMICYDEAASLPLALLVVPAAARSPLAFAAAFALHRLFDITKPFPCRRLERLPVGLGIMADDWGAAAYAAACLTAARILGGI